MAERYDLLLKGGTVIDPSQGLQQRCDVAFGAGRVAALAPDLPIAAQPPSAKALSSAHCAWEVSATPRC